MRPRKPPRGPCKRTSFDVPIDLHLRWKVECAKRGVLMRDALRELLEREFPAAPVRKPLGRASRSLEA
jgi:hypothetical protein